MSVGPGGGGGASCGGSAVCAVAARRFGHAFAAVDRQSEDGDEEGGHERRGSNEQADEGIAPGHDGAPLPMLRGGALR